MRPPDLFDAARNVLGYRASRLRRRQHLLDEMTQGQRGPLSRRRLQFVASGQAQSTESIGYADEWLKTWKRKPFFVLTGRRGSGKSLAALYALWHCDNRIQVVTPGDVLRHAYDAEWFDDTAAARRLLIDDVGELDPSSVAWMTLSDLIDRRYHHERVTAITSNLPLARFERAVGERVWDRFREVAGVVYECVEATKRADPVEFSEEKWQRWLAEPDRCEVAAAELNNPEGFDEGDLREIVESHGVAWDAVERELADLQRRDAEQARLARERERNFALRQPAGSQ